MHRSKKQSQSEMPITGLQRIGIGALAAFLGAGAPSIGALIAGGAGPGSHESLKIFILTVLGVLFAATVLTDYTDRVKVFTLTAAIISGFAGGLAGLNNKGHETSIKDFRITNSQEVKEFQSKQSEQAADDTVRLRSSDHDPNGNLIGDPYSPSTAESWLGFMLNLTSSAAIAQPDSDTLPKVEEMTYIKEDATLYKFLNITKLSDARSTQTLTKTWFVILSIPNSESALKTEYFATVKFIKALPPDDPSAKGMIAKLYRMPEEGKPIAVVVGANLTRDEAVKTQKYLHEKGWTNKTLLYKYLGQ